MAWGYKDGVYGWIEEPGQANPTTGAPPSPAAPGGGILDLLTVNWEDGSNARYDVSKMSPNGDGTYSYGGYQFDSEGRPLTGGVPGDGPGQWVDGRPGARGGGGPGGGQSGTGAGGPLTGSPYYQQVLAATNAAGAADAAGRRSAIQQALISFGLVPEGFQDKYGDIDALTRDLAGKNTSSGLSTRARLLEARSDAIKQFSRGLSARGLRRSGAKGYGLRRRQLDFDRSYSDALGKLLGYTGGLYNQFAGNEYQRQLGLAGALANASQSLGNYGTQQSSSAFTPSWAGTWAQGIDTGGYVPGSNTITDYGTDRPISVGSGGRLAY